MTIAEINRAYNRIVGSLDNKELKNAFVFLHGMISGLQTYDFQSKLSGLQDTYTYMLRYKLEGANDPMQEQIYHSLLISAYELTDQVNHKALEEVSPLLFYNKRRSLQLVPMKSYSEIHAQLQIPIQNQESKSVFENTLNRLFEQIWISGPLTSDDVIAIKEILYDDTLPITVGCQVISALWMGLQTYFDKEKLFLLFDALYLEEEEKHVRAIISIMLTLYFYRKRMFLYPQVVNRLAAFSETYPALTKEIRTIILRFILSRETEKITRRLHEEIIPEMIKLSPKLHKKINPKDFMADTTGEEMNPEWEEIMSESSSLNKKMEEFSELQMEGADVMHSTFIHLKNFPFFREMSNWFLPFTPEHSAFDRFFNEGNKENEVLRTLASASFICDSDKYSLCFSMLQLPDQHRSAMLSQFTGQAAEMIEQQKEELITKHINIEALVGQYIQNLYRFYKLFPGKKDFEDIFALPLDFHNLKPLESYISDKESLMIIAEYYLRKNYITDALPIFEHLSKEYPENDTLFQKIGYCKQLVNDLQGALKAYQYADLLNPESKWLLKRIASCYRTLKQPEEALKYYHRYEILNPEDLSVQLNIGHCFLELKEYDNALKHYFKVDYLDTKNHRAWRPIAWISFLTGKYDQACNYYGKILENQPGMQDYLNAGHTEWTLNNIKRALKFYAQAVKAESSDIYKFLEQFNQDIPDLLGAGIEEDEIPLVLDQLRYMLDGEF